MSVRALVLAPATPVLSAGDAAGEVCARTIVTIDKLIRAVPRTRTIDFIITLLLFLLTGAEARPETSTPSLNGPHRSSGASTRIVLIARRLGGKNRTRQYNYVGVLL